MNTGETTGLSGTGLLTNFVIGGLPASLPSAPALRFRGVNQTPMTTHNLTLRPVSGAQVCGTGNLAGGAASTFTVTNLAPGTYQLYCTIHAPMVANITITLTSTHVAVPLRRSIRPGPVDVRGHDHRPASLRFGQQRRSRRERLLGPAVVERIPLGVLDVQRVMDDVGEVEQHTRVALDLEDAVPRAVPRGRARPHAGQGLGTVGERLDHACVAQRAQDSRTDHQPAALGGGPVVEIDVEQAHRRPNRMRA